MTILPRARWTCSCASLLIALVVASCGPAPATPPPAPPQLDRTIDGARWESGDWTPDLPAGPAGSSLGHHRAVIRVDEAAPAVVATIHWRRADDRSADINVVLVDSTSGAPVTNRLIVSADFEAGLIVFRPNPGSTTYYAYYYPYETTGGYYPSVTFLTPRTSADPDWLDQVGLLDEAALTGLPAAQVTAIQSADAFHDFFPMEVAATQAEMDSLRSRSPDALLLFPEDRLRPVRMRERLPRHWAADGPASEWSGTAQPGEYYTFQIGAWAASDSVGDLRIRLRDFTDGRGDPLPDGAVSNFNTSGVDLDGDAFVQRIGLARGEVLPLWFGVDVGPGTPGPITGVIEVGGAGTPPKTVQVTVEVRGEEIPNRGFDDPTRMSRLAWLNSTVGDDPDFIIDPYEPVDVSGLDLGILGRQITLGPTGLPDRIQSRMTPRMTELGDPVDILARPVDLVVETASGVVEWDSDGFEPRSVAAGRAEWITSSSHEDFDLQVHGALEYDGMLDYRMVLVARRNVEVRDVRLPVAYEAGAATYLLGLGHRGGQRPDRVDWRWNVENHQEGVWMGDVNRGLQYVLRDRNYVRPLNTNFYRNQPLNLPPSWYNQGRGGIRIEEEGAAVTATNYSGSRSLSAGDTLHFHVRFLITPFRPLDTAAHFRTRFVHQYVPVDSVKAWGGTVVNIHHANAINPYINYPFFALPEQKAYIDEAHEKGIKVKLYYTIRELTYQAHELFALRSLGTEILNDGEGGGHPWLQEHLRGGYHAAWHAWRVDDAAILNKGTSRWTNYYVEGLNWLADRQQIDGLYLDDIAFSRETVKRMVSVLHRHRDDVVIDLHSANQYNVRDGWINSAFLYMEHIPYVSRLWFGEYFEYDRGPDYWMTEVAGIPFGIMGEMLQDGGHPYRGLLYGMTARKYGNVDPRPVWQMMTDFGIDESRMLGYWLPDAPVTVADEDLRATAYVRPGETLVVIASWSDRDLRIPLSVDWQALGVDDPGTARLEAPAVEGLQEARTWSANDEMTVPAGQGLFLIIRTGPDSLTPPES